MQGDRLTLERNTAPRHSRHLERQAGPAAVTAGIEVRLGFSKVNQGAWISAQGVLRCVATELDVVLMRRSTSAAPPVRNLVGIDKTR